MNLAEHFRQRRSRTAPGASGRATSGISGTAVLTRRHVALVLGLRESTVASIEIRALGKVKNQMEGEWRLMGQE